MGESINVFLPMRAGSVRVPNKNTREFSGISGGLCMIKLEQLLSSKRIHNIYVSTDDPEAIEICKNFKSNKIRLRIRPSALASSSTSTDELIKHVPEVIPEGHILWTHVTSPFITARDYDDIIKAYNDKLKQFDSLMTVTKVQKFIWNDDTSLNYDREVEKWPRTQTLKPLWEVNSGVFLAHRRIYVERSDRIGVKPFLYELSGKQSFDIDWIDDFHAAETLYQST